MHGAIYLLVAYTPLFNTVPPKYRSNLHIAWVCSFTATSLSLDLYQILVYPLSQEEEADLMFAACNETMTKKYLDGHVIYSHGSLRNGTFYSGIEAKHITLIPVYHAGLVTTPRLDCKDKVQALMVNRTLRWRRITPDDILKDCFDGYSLVSLQGLQSFKVSFNKECWLDLGEKELAYLQLAGQKYFPFIIQPTRLDLIEFSIKWKHLVIEDSIRTYSENDTEKLLKYLYNNQSKDSLRAAYGSGYPASLPASFLDLVHNKRQQTFASIIQRWWTQIYYDPCHPVGRRMLMRSADFIRCDFLKC